MSDQAIYKQVQRIVIGSTDKTISADLISAGKLVEAIKDKRLRFRASFELETLYMLEKAVAPKDCLSL